jgi:membrane protease subunit HflC
MSVTKLTVGIGVFVAVLFMATCLFTVTQGQNGLLLRLGRIVTDKQSGEARVFPPGLHLKAPFIESVRIFDTRLQTVDIKSSRIVTKEKKDVIVDYYVKWRISNLARYFKATGGNQFKAETLLEQQINTSLRAQFGKRTISDVVSSDRGDVMEVLREGAERQAGQLGIHVVDVRIKGIELPPNTSNAIYQRMRADMQKIANGHRADGSATAEAIQAESDARVTIILAKARSDGQMLRGQGQATAALIYANAYNQNADFFAFYRSLKAYQASFNQKNDILVLDPNTAFFEYFKNGLSKGNKVSVKH